MRDGWYCLDRDQARVPGQDEKCAEDLCIHGYQIFSQNEVLTLVFPRTRVIRDIMNIESWATRGSAESAHGWLQSWITGLAEQYGFRGWREELVPYVSRYGVPREGRLDIVWLDDVYVVAAFEVDGRVKQKSIAKLENLNAERFIVSYTQRADLWETRIDGYRSVLAEAGITVLAPLCRRTYVDGLIRRWKI